MQVYQGDIQDKTTTLVRSLHESCQRQFSAMDKRLSNVEGSVDGLQMQLNRSSSELRAEIQE
eukprot:4804984-Karenia_brevis.AAC.1